MVRRNEELYAAFVQPVKGHGIAARVEQIAAGRPGQQNTTFESPLGNLSSAMTGCIELAVELEEAGDSEQVAEIELSLKTLIDMENELLLQREVIQEMARDLNGSKELNDLATEFDTMLKRKEFDRTHKADKYTRHDSYRSFKTSVWEVHKKGPHPFAEPADDNADLVLEAVHRKPICPITRQPFKQPMTAKECGHSFEKSAILDLFEQQVEFECPQSGCPKILKKVNLFEDKDLRRQARLYIESQREQRELEEDSMDVVA
ncbi:hypothetical protein M427DRAFT_158718 [Gonapodya prolifera JEL478]|uniref:SP-RING-type domain-containing protein n=1 Tax=Gonapodya prolifera (strain JEL478) TaxID=1344416 RepID=A0A139A277_GONPJ|nr:hypothetical protein M427DRAFT_158718 [Gonapodya prolifera JEL478]|eukprot:KXS10900.1 hypothetical protein M427DRAFT_158718 [Gonapodya prolifera JEL478]